MAGLWREVQGAVTSSPSAIEAIFALLQSLSVTLSQRLAAIFWSLWKHRNIKVWEDITETCATVVDRARSLTDEWHLANGPAAGNLTAVPAGTHIAAVNTTPSAVTTAAPAVSAAAPAAFQPAAASVAASDVPTAVQQR